MRHLNPIDLLWPPRCAACDERCEHPLCDVCELSLVEGHHTFCPHCGLVWLDPPEGVGPHRCGDCLTSPPPWRGARAAFAYGGAIRDAIRRWKNAPEETLGQALASLMVQSEAMRFFTELPAHTCIVPVPTHRQQLRKRGFNPAGVLASALSKATGRPMQATTLECRKPRPSTKGLGQLARRARRTSDFTTRKGHRFHGPVLLVDDVMTTGATIRAVTRRCLKSGATEVWVAVLARTPRD